MTEYQKFVQIARKPDPNDGAKAFDHLTITSPPRLLPDMFTSYTNPEYGLSKR